jgi:hypothetical protein
MQVVTTAVLFSQYPKTFYEQEQTLNRFLSARIENPVRIPQKIIIFQMKVKRPKVALIALKNGCRTVFSTRPS